METQSRNAYVELSHGITKLSLESCSTDSQDNEPPPNTTGVMGFLNGSALNAQPATQAIEIQQTPDDEHSSIEEYDASSYSSLGTIMEDPEHEYEYENEYARLLANTSDDKHSVVVLLGPEASGKTTLRQNILLLAGVYNNYYFDGYDYESTDIDNGWWAPLWSTDNGLEESAGNVATKSQSSVFKTQHKSFTFLNLPKCTDCRDCKPEGIEQADIAILLVPACPNEFEAWVTSSNGNDSALGKQIALAKDAGVRNLIVAVNKMDDLSVAWSNERYNEVVSKVSPLLEACGYDAAQCTFIPISGFTGSGVKDCIGAACPWYTGDSLLECLDKQMGYSGAAIPLHKQQLFVAL
ncbi:translation termination factor GTPase eRF3 [Coemansia sp. Benny D115]|nr:translation termination factor GTPase eRF3 [Coemansia sp. Benny D115]